MSEIGGHASRARRDFLCQFLCQGLRPSMSELRNSAARATVERAPLRRRTLAPEFRTSGRAGLSVHLGQFPAQRRNREWIFNERLPRERLVEGR